MPVFPLSLLIRAMPAGEEVGGEGRGEGSPWAPRTACKHANECQLYKNSPSSHILLQTKLSGSGYGKLAKGEGGKGGVCVGGGVSPPKTQLILKD